LAEANSSYCGSSQLMPTMYRILKDLSCSSNFLGQASLPSGCTTQSSNSASAVSYAEHTGTSWTKSSNNLDTASTEGATGAENSHSVSALCSSELVGVDTRLNAKIISVQKGTVNKRSHSTSVVTGSELTSVNLTTSTASTPSVTGAESIY